MVLQWIHNLFPIFATQVYGLVWMVHRRQLVLLFQLSQITRLPLRVSLMLKRQWLYHSCVVGQSPPLSSSIQYSLFILARDSMMLPTLTSSPSPTRDSTGGHEFTSMFLPFRAIFCGVASGELSFQMLLGQFIIPMLVVLCPLENCAVKWEPLVTFTSSQASLVACVWDRLHYRTSLFHPHSLWHPGRVPYSLVVTQYPSLIVPLMYQHGHKMRELSSQYIACLQQTHGYIIICCFLGGLEWHREERAGGGLLDGERRRPSLRRSVFHPQYEMVVREQVISAVGAPNKIFFFVSREEIPKLTHRNKIV